MLFVLLFLLQDSPSVPGIPALSPTGQVLLAIYGFFSLGLNIWLVFRSKTTKALQESVTANESATKALKEEMEVYKERSERLHGENIEVRAKNAALEAKTDLTPLMESIATQIRLSQEQMDLSRKFERESAQITSNVSSVLERLLASESSGHKMLTEALENNRETIGEMRDVLTELRRQVQEDCSQNSKNSKGFNEILTSLVEEVRLLRTR